MKRKIRTFEFKTAGGSNTDVVIILAYSFEDAVRIFNTNRGSMTCKGGIRSVNEIWNVFSEEILEQRR